MPQVIVKSTMDQFYFALNHAARVRPIIGMWGCSPAEDISLQVAKEFHRRNPSVNARRGAHDFREARRKHAALLDNFYSKVCHVRLAKEGNTAVGGFVVLDGELLGLHNVHHGKGDWMLREAVGLGANRLDCFDVPHLIEMYERHGFREILREPNTTKGQPDVVWMRLHEGT